MNEVLLVHPLFAEILDRNGLGGLFFLRIYYFSIDLSCPYIGVPHHLTQGIDICSVGELDCCVAMSEAVQNYRDCRLKQMKAVGTVNGCK